MATEKGPFPWGRLITLILSIVWLLVHHFFGFDLPADWIGYIADALAGTLGAGAIVKSVKEKKAAAAILLLVGCFPVQAQAQSLGDCVTRWGQCYALLLNDFNARNGLANAANAWFVRNEINAVVYPWLQCEIYGRECRMTWTDTLFTPHQDDVPDFESMTVEQCEATVAACQATREQLVWPHIVAGTATVQQQLELALYKESLVKNAECKSIQPGELWKPVSESYGTPVILLDPALDGQSLSVQDASGNQVATIRRASCCKNPNRQFPNGRAHWYLSQSCGKLKGPVFVRVGGQCRRVDDPCRRYGN